MHPGNRPVIQKRKLTRFRLGVHYFTNLLVRISTQFHANSSASLENQLNDRLLFELRVGNNGLFPVSGRLNRCPAFPCDIIEGSALIGVCQQENLIRRFFRSIKCFRPHPCGGADLFPCPNRSIFFVRKRCPFFSGKSDSKRKLGCGNAVLKKTRASVIKRMSLFELNCFFFPVQCTVQLFFIHELKSDTLVCFLNRYALFRSSEGNRFSIQPKCGLPVQHRRPG